MSIPSGLVTLNRQEKLAVRLREDGLSYRAICAATGLGYGKVYGIFNPNYVQRCLEHKRKPESLAKAYENRDKRLADPLMRSKSILVRINRTARSKGYSPCTSTAEEMASKFTGECHICGVKESDCRTRLHADHCHKTGKFRGWLCNDHNLILGKVEPHAERIMEYLHVNT